MRPWGSHPLGPQAEVWLIGTRDLAKAAKVQLPPQILLICAFYYPFCIPRCRYGCAVPNTYLTMFETDQR